MISEHHREQYRLYYAQRQPIEPRPNQWLPRIEALAEQLGAHSILDYGCGVARGVSRFARIPTYDYDPAVPGCDAPPSPADLVVSIHALEHVEPDYLVDVVIHMESLARKALLVVISCEESTKTLPDGRPWHCLVRPPQWWRAALPAYFELEPLKEPGREWAALWRSPGGAP